MVGLGALIGGVANIGASLIGGKQRREEARQLEAQYRADVASIRGMQFTNPFKGVENPFEDITVPQFGFQARAQQIDQNMAQTLAALTASGGGGGVPAQAIANATLKANTGLTADIEKAESLNQRLAAGFSGKAQFAQARGEEDLQTARYNQGLDLALLSAGQKRQADKAQQFATAQLGYGIGQFIGGASEEGGLMSELLNT